MATTAACIRSVCSRVIQVFVVIAFVTPVVRGQRITGELRLVVTDPLGAALQASGTIVGEATGVNRTFATDESGRFIVRALPPGKYQVIVRREGFEPQSAVIEIQSQLPLEHRVTLRIARLNSSVEVREVDTLLDPVRTAQYIPSQILQDRPVSLPGRSVIGVVNMQPGWLLEANGVLHPRGSEYDVQYVVDGIPLYDNRSPAFADSSNLEESHSLNVRTSGYPAEFGLKLGGVIEIGGDQETPKGLHGQATLAGGSFDNHAASVGLHYAQGRTAAAISADAMATDRYLDPPVEENFTNHASGGGLSGQIERDWSPTDRTRFYAYRDHTGFLVPNELVQQAAGQRQDRTATETLAQGSHTHIFSSRVLGQFRAMTRETSALLWSNEASTPIRPAQDRRLRDTYVAGSISAHYGNHELKAGVEGSFTSIREDLSFHIVTDHVGTTLIFDPDLPRDFRFFESSKGQTQSAFIQDMWRFGKLNVSAGLRFDRYRLVARDTAWSPRLGAAYEFAKAGIVLRAYYDRVFQIPAVENILFASSNQLADLGGEGNFLPLGASRGNFFETSFSKSVTRHVRLDGTWYHRSFQNFSDDSLLLNTGITFPIAFAHASISGFETKIDLHSLGRFSGQLSYSNMVGVGELPVAGGLFLGDDVEKLVTGVGAFPITQDQRNTLRARFRVQLARRVWAAAAYAYNSGLPFEIEGPQDPQFISQQYGASILEQINEERGRVRPSKSLDASVGVDLMQSDRLKVRFQIDAFNLTNRLNLINFAGVFSGTAVDAPRNFTLRLRTEF
jgi:TonB dependent receptor/Carboxypeptidase regulatory-like domain